MWIWKLIRCCCKIKIKKIWWIIITWHLLHLYLGDQGLGLANSLLQCICVHCTCFCPVSLTIMLPFQIVDSIPHSWIVYNRYTLPLPSASPRDVCLQRMWMPSYLTRNGTSGTYARFLKKMACTYWYYQTFQHIREM